LALVLLWILGSAVLVSAISLVGIFTLAIKERLLSKILLGLIGFSAGALMGGALLHLVPEALERDTSFNVFSYVILGFILFFLLEKVLYWRHCHNGVCDVHIFTYLNLIGDGIHNFIDGMLLAVSFVVGIELGIVTMLAVILHEIPQELGDFGVLVYGGFGRAKALFYNFLSAFTAVFGALLGYYLSSYVENFTMVLVPIAAGGFLYISGSDLIPELHREPDIRKSMLSFLFFLVGVIFMWVL